MQTIYVDVLIVLNIYVNFFLLRITSGITHSPLKTGRCIGSSAFGSLFSLLILAPQLNKLLTSVINLTAAALIVIVAFGFCGRRRLTINISAFFASNIILAGTVYGVYSWLKPEFVHINNSFFYIDFSLIILVLTTAALYLIVYIGRILLDRTPSDTDCYRIIVRYKKKIIALNGLADTGNSLVDFFTGSPVIVCDSAEFGFADISLLTVDKLPKGFRLLPCSTISENSLIPVFRPDEVLILNTVSGEKKPVDAVIGLAQSSGEAIFNPKLLKL